MGKAGGLRNFGFGKQMAWAGMQALDDRYGQGHYGTKAAHAERWAQFALYAKSNGVRDARDVSMELLRAYANNLREQVVEGRTSVSYAQNLLSTANVVIETMRGDSKVRVSPSSLVGERSSVRKSMPQGLDRAKLQVIYDDLKLRNEQRILAVAQLARELGLRFREASLLDARTAAEQAHRLGRVNVTEGTKGGRGRETDRWIPVGAHARHALDHAAQLQGSSRNVIPEQMTFVQWRNHMYAVWSDVAGRRDLHGFHDLRAAYACERYQQLTGHPAPVVSAGRSANKTNDLAARTVIARELGHGRTDVVAAYVGSAR